MNRGLAVPISFKLLTSAEKHTEDSIKLANILGWCIELVSIEKGLLKLGITCMNRFVIKVKNTAETVSEYPPHFLQPSDANIFFGG